MTENGIQTPDLLIQHGYVYRSLIGEGANGKTYLGQNLKTGEIVAIKALKFSDSLKNYELFKREAETLQAISHPGVPRFYEFIMSQTEFTECWIVQEYVEGRSILDVLEDKKSAGKNFTIKETFELIYETVQIVCALHKNYAPPIIHRDIKPSNILIRAQGEMGNRVALIDFGAVANPAKRSSQSTVAGTVGYMAPEQLLGDCTIQSDYYAIGATALHMLTGIIPSDLPSDGFQLQFEAALQESVPDCPDELMQFFSMLLAPNITDRPANADIVVSMMNLVIERLNSSCKSEYLVVKNKYTKYSMDNRHHQEVPTWKAGLWALLVLVLGILGLWLIWWKHSGNIWHIWDGGWKVWGSSLVASLYAAYACFRREKPRYRDLSRLEKKLEQLQIIEVKKVVPVKPKQPKLPQPESSDTHMYDDEIVVQGTIAAVIGNQIEYYYLVDGLARCGSVPVTEEMRQLAEKTNYEIKVGAKIDVIYYYDDLDKTCIVSRVRSPEPAADMPAEQS